MIFFYLGKINNMLAAGWLAAASLFFYGWWNPGYVGLLLVSVIFNYTLGMWIAKARVQQKILARKHLLVFAVSVNLLLLSYYKYANFFLTSIDYLVDTQWSFDNILLPLGISFFTFTQIAFLVDTYRGEVKEYNFAHYGLFVTYFPHLIAGPVLHHKEMMPQFALRSTYTLHLENIAIGLSFFAIGLFKKVVLADGVSPYVTPVFAYHANEVVTFPVAWGGVLAYTFQLYFDFSGYSDMAIGLSYLIGVKLPLNFDSPYKAINIVDFWRRWHMTLSRFLRDYLYIPLGGNKKGKMRRYINLMVTMLLGGLWHGAGWTFVIWGGLHGVYLVINHGWSAFRKALGQRMENPTWWGRVSGRFITFVAVVVAWVFFRADNIDIAFALLKSMAGLNGMTLPDVWLTKWTTEGPWLEVYYWIAGLLAIAWFMPNSQMIMENGRVKKILLQKKYPSLFNIYSAIAAILVLIIFLAFINASKGASEFIYFNF